MRVYQFHHLGAAVRADAVYWSDARSASGAGIVSKPCGASEDGAIGAASGYGCYLAVVKVKRTLGYDDSLDAFGVHGVGGVIGALLTGVFIHSGLGGVGLDEGVTMIAQVGKQVVGIGATIIYCGGVSFIILKVLDSVIGLRVSDEEEQEGLDLVLHDEQGYNLGINQ